MLKKKLKRLVVAGLVASLIAPLATAGIDAQAADPTEIKKIAEVKAADPYEVNGTYTFDFNQLDFDEEASKTSGQNEKGATVSVNSAGDAVFSFYDQYAQVFFKLPDGMNSRRVSNVKFNVTNEGGDVAVKVLPKPGDDSLQDLGGATWGGSSLNIANKGFNFAYFSAMSMQKDPKQVSVSS
ncbi:MAG: hypothetical protein K6E18_06130, partial [Lachnospiraceae bacterium]|nr:hypothetical protein [Lachnospiraceae bacterium]